MGKSSNIQWTDATYNPWHGCRKVSAGCKFCYMFRDKERYKQDPTVVLRSKSNFTAPLFWDKPKLIFTCSWSDWFIEEADEWRKEAWKIIKATPWHTYQILTKRPERILQHLPPDWGDGYPNVWLGVSVENQEYAELRIPILSQIPARVRFLSCEPLLGPLNLGEFLPGIQWVILGGESGNDTGKYRYRQAKLSWFGDIMADCDEHSVPVFMKQTGTYLAKEMGLKDRHGGDWDEWEYWMTVREFPRAYIKPENVLP